MNRPRFHVTPKNPRPWIVIERTGPDPGCSECFPEHRSRPRVYRGKPFPFDGQHVFYSERVRFCIASRSAEFMSV